MALNIGLDELLKSDDLDEALHLAEELNPNDPVVQKQIEEYLEKKWTDALGICNLLQNCRVIPEKIRETYLLKGLNETKGYYVLSACVGYQSLALSSQVQAKLKEIIQKDSSFIAPRAFTSLSENIKFPDELPYVASLLSHTHSTVFHNARAWILSNIQNMNPTQQKELFVKHAIPEVDISKIEEAVKLLEKEKDKPFSSLTFPLMSYIPNLVEVEEIEAKNKKFSAIFEQIKDKDGLLTVNGLQKWLHSVGVKLDLDNLKEDIAEISTVKPEHLSCHEFCTFASTRLRFGK